MNVFLIGFMGSGKTSLGKKIANKLNRTFIDLDDLIEGKEGKSISELFSEKGENYFRQIEKSVLLSQSKDKEVVVSLGGGACCNEESWKFMENNGLIIYLKEKPEILFGRLKQNKNQRPLIAHLPDEDLKEFIDKKLSERSIYYDKAHFVYEKDKSSFKFLVKQINDFL